MSLDMNVLHQANYSRVLPTGNKATAGRGRILDAARHLPINAVQGVERCGQGAFLTGSKGDEQS